MIWYAVTNIPRVNGFEPRRRVFKHDDKDVKLLDELRQRFPQAIVQKAKTRKEARRLVYLADRNLSRLENTAKEIGSQIRTSIDRDVAAMRSSTLSKFKMSYGLSDATGRLIEAALNNPVQQGKIAAIRLLRRGATRAPHDDEWIVPHGLSLLAAKNAIEQYMAQTGR